MADTVRISMLYENDPQSHEIILDKYGPEHVLPGNGS